MMTPFAPWNNPIYKDNPLAPHNGIDADNPLKPWNNPLGKKEDLTDREAERYGIYRKKYFDEEEN